MSLAGRRFPTSIWFLRVGRLDEIDFFVWVVWMMTAPDLTRLCCSETEPNLGSRSLSGLHYRPLGGV